MENTTLTLENAVRFMCHPTGVRDFADELYGSEHPKLVRLAMAVDVTKYVLTGYVLGYVLMDYTTNHLMK